MLWKLFQRLDRNSFRNLQIKLLISQSLIQDDLLYRHRDLIRLQRPDDSNCSGKFRCSKIAVVTVRRLRFQIALSIVDVLFIGQQIFAVEADNADRG